MVHTVISLAHSHVWRSPTRCWSCVAPQGQGRDTSPNCWSRSSQASSDWGKLPSSSRSEIASPPFLSLSIPSPFPLPLPPHHHRVSHTTRPQQSKESHGRDYYYIDESTFDRATKSVRGNSLCTFQLLSCGFKFCSFFLVSSLKQHLLH